MNRRHRLVAALGVLSIAVAACGGGDDESASETATASEPAITGETATATASPGDGPGATVAPNLPEEIVGEVGPLEVDGDALPLFDQSVTTDTDPARGMAAPVMVGQDFDGNTVRVEATDGPVLVVFLAHWCSHCNNEIPRINELRDAGSFPADLSIIGVSTAIDPTQPNWPPSEWIPNKDWTYPVIADGVDMEAGEFIGASAYGVGGFPFITLIGADGTVKARWAGEHTPDEFLELVTSNLA